MGLHGSKADKSPGKSSKEIDHRLDFLVNVGLSYLSLDRGASSLPGGRSGIRLRHRSERRLTGGPSTYSTNPASVSIRATTRSFNTLFSLRDLGNTVVVIEHDKETMLAADYLIDIGPGAGKLGDIWLPRVLRREVPRILVPSPAHIFRAKKTIPKPARRRKGTDIFWKLSGASGHNLKNVKALFPLGSLVCITGFQFGQKLPHQ